MNLQLDGQGALYEQLARALKYAILKGHLAANSRLPATRQLAQLLNISRNTVLGAYELLCVEHLAVARPGSGTRVAQTLRQVPKPRPTIRPPSRYAQRLRSIGPTALASRAPRVRYNLQYGEPLLNPPLFHMWRRKLSAAALLAGPRYPSPGGYPPLRRAISEYLQRRRGILCTEHDVLIVGGTQQALTLTARVVLNERNIAVIEDPHYELVLQTLTAHGANVVSVRADSNGLVTAEIPKRGVRLICVSPAHQFPSGSVMSVNRRSDLLGIVQKQGSWIFEDDYDSEFCYGGRPLPALRSQDLADRVIYVGTFSKTLFPSLRLGYIVCPQGLRDDLFTAKKLDDLGSPAIEQAALAAFIQSGQYDKHLSKSMIELRRRRRALLEGLQRHAGAHIHVDDSQAGMHVVAWFRQFSYAQFERLTRLAAAQGVGLHPIHPYFKRPPPHPGLLLGFAGLRVQQIEAATESLGRCLKELRGA